MTDRTIIVYAPHANGGRYLSGYQAADTKAEAIVLEYIPQGRGARPFTYRVESGPGVVKGSVLTSESWHVGSDAFFSDIARQSGGTFASRPGRPDAAHTNGPVTRSRVAPAKAAAAAPAAPVATADAPDIEAIIASAVATAVTAAVAAYLAPAAAPVAPTTRAASGRPRRKV